MHNNGQWLDFGIVVLIEPLNTVDDSAQPLESNGGGGCIIVVTRHSQVCGHDLG